MAQETPRVRPMVTSGSSSVSQPSSEGGGRPLAGGVTLMCGDQDLSFQVGTVFLGRGADCAVIFDDPLVSRKHAKLIVTNEEVVITDLRSANGVYVNGTRIHRPHRILDGDRILIGTREVSVFSYRPSSVPDFEANDRPTLDVNEQELAAAQQQPDGEHESRPAATGPVSALTDSERQALTQRADAFRFVGRLADKMLSLGKYAEAERVLFDHMTKILHGARAGLPVPRDVLDSAGSYAMKLAKSTRRGVWIDYAVELHTLAREQMAEPVVDALCDAIQVATSVDRAIYTEYLELLQRMISEMTPAERLLLNRLECLNLPGA